MARLIFVLLVIACNSIPTAKQSVEHATQLAANNNWRPEKITTKKFDVQSYHKLTNKNSPLTIYLEGDGYAWVTRSKISRNPTPRKLMFLKLAMLDAADNVVYLARPCQFVLNNSCSDNYWSTARYSLEIVSAVEQAIVKLQKHQYNKDLHLIGYSGGGSIAALIAEHNPNVKHLITIAGNLDLKEFARYTGTTPLMDSLDPLRVAHKLSHIPQIHYLGTEDKIISPNMATNFINQQTNPVCAKLEIIPNVTHNNWLSVWQNLPRYCDLIPD